METKLRAVFLCFALLGLACQKARASDLPRFFGVYIENGGNYIEVPRVQGSVQKYNQRKTSMGFDFNVRGVFERKSFVPVLAAKFNTDGFLVVLDPEWSDFQLLRVPHVSKKAEDGAIDLVVTSVGISGSMMGMPVSNQGLDEPVAPTNVELKKAKAGENAYVLVPAAPLEKGFYVIDYKKNGQGFVGFNPIELVDMVTDVAEQDALRTLEAKKRSAEEKARGAAQVKERQEEEKTPDEKCGERDESVLSKCKDVKYIELPGGLKTLMGKMKCDVKTGSTYDYGYAVDLNSDDSPEYAFCCQESGHGPCGMAIFGKAANKWVALYDYMSGVSDDKTPCLGVVALREKHSGYNDVCLIDGEVIRFDDVKYRRIKK